MASDMTRRTLAFSPLVASTAGERLTTGSSVSVGQVVHISSLHEARRTTVPEHTEYLITLGYAGPGDGGGGTYCLSADGGDGSGEFKSREGRSWKLREARPNVLQFGADPTGNLPSDDAFRAAVGFIAKNARKNFGFGADPNRLGGSPLQLPRGTYRLTKSGSILSEKTFDVRTVGLELAGDGAGPTQIIFDTAPDDAFPALLVDMDRIQGLRCRGIEFNSTSEANTFCRSESNGGSSDFLFEDCAWSGRWRYGFDLTGSNTNSEMKWVRCGFYGSWNSFLNVGNDNTSDQFLNYWFSESKYWSSSTWISMKKGGHIGITMCDVSGFKPERPTYLFEALGKSHAQGVCFINVDGLRVELRSPHARLLRSEWPHGMISVRALDLSSQAFVRPWTDTELLTVDLSTGLGPLITIETSQLCGHARITGKRSSSTGASAISFARCRFLNVPSLEQFAGTGMHHVAFKDCDAAIGLT